MKIPYLRKKPELKSCHNVTWEDNYSWIHQENILEVLRDKDKLLPEVREYLEKENEYTDHHLNNTKTTSSSVSVATCTVHMLHSYDVHTYRYLIMRKKSN